MRSQAPRQPMHAEHATLLKELRGAARPTSGARQHNDSYSGSGRPFLNVAVPDRRAIIKGWLARHKTMVGEQVVPIVDSLFRGESHEEKTLGALLIAAHANAREQVDPARLDGWLGQLALQFQQRHSAASPISIWQQASR